MRRDELFQWFGLLGAPLAWTLQLVLGFGVTSADCSQAGSRFGIDGHTWQIVLMAAAVGVVLLAEAAALTIFLETRELEHDGPPPDARRHFFASAAAVGNVLFLGAVILSGIGALEQSCRSA